MAHLKAPWTPEQVQHLNKWQEGMGVHPFTCGRFHKEPHNLVATEFGWVCSQPQCDYWQDWCHDYMANGEWLSAVTRTLERIKRGDFKNGVSSDDYDETINGID